MTRCHQFKGTTRSNHFLVRPGLRLALFTLALAGGMCRPSASQDAQAKPEALKPMPADADPSYEVATIKPSSPDEQSDGFDMKGRHMLIKNETVDKMLTLAYGVHPRQIVDAPAWFATEQFDVDGVLDVEGFPNLNQMRAIVKKLLAGRFQLAFHHEQRELAVYALTVAKAGPKIAPSTLGANEHGSEGTNSRGGQETMKVKNLSMADFALVLQFHVDRPVIDRTGLAGKWDFKWTWTVDESRVPPDSNAAPGLFTAIQEQLGLKLEAVKAPADVFVIDHVERPSAN